MEVSAIEHANIERWYGWKDGNDFIIIIIIMGVSKS